MAPQYSEAPFVLNKDLGRPQMPTEDAYCKVNSEGRPVPELTTEEKYAFDLRGWLLIPGVLTEDEMVPMREHLRQLHEDRESIPEKDRSSLGGPCVSLIDHPVVVAFMTSLSITRSPMARRHHLSVISTATASGWSTASPNTESPAKANLPPTMAAARCGYQAITTPTTSFPVTPNRPSPEHYSNSTR